MNIAEIKIRLLELEIFRRKITPISRSIEFAQNFPDEIKNKNQLQRFLGWCLTYV